MGSSPSSLVTDEVPLAKVECSTTTLKHTQQLHTSQQLKLEDGSSATNVISLQMQGEACVNVHNQRIESLQMKLKNQFPKKKYLPLEEYEKISKEQKTIQYKIQEYELQRNEFNGYMQILFSFNKEATQQNELERKFSRECNRLSAALPIYARRSEVIETVCNSCVTVLVGETGSGKSTQVVQYLYEAGIAEHGIIACTQPRKVAAITLAKHVSKEMQVSLGEELGYRVGMNEKCGDKTKVMFMTDHMLLNECITDHMLSRYSCILIDEAHERNINTDMLLAFLKQCLLSRKNLKVVIMSATIEPELFVNYFKETAADRHNVVSTVMVSGRAFPVEVEYDPLSSKTPLSPDSNYVMHAVDLVKAIHAKEPPGDILVFLTCAPEIERACRAVEYLQNEVIILPLHGKLPPEEQQKVFDDSSNKRKVIFSTNVAETSVTIPGVKYVIDTGLAKEMHFDPRKNMDSLEVCMISKSSAEQRKGRAGRVSSGKCFRLYTADDYESKMPSKTKPEILRIHLSQVVLKMLEFGVPNVLTFDFVEHPDHIALEAAVNTLKSVGAIENNCLTDVGRKMAVLPLQPQLSKVLLDAVHIGLGIEALISVALSSLAGQVFFRSGTGEMKEESDRKKLPFCHPMGDQMTSLSVYQCWQEQEVNQRKKWCVDNYVNAKSMHIVEEMVRELRHTLRKQLKINLPLNLKSLEAAECYLGELYFHAFINNLGLYLGHQRAGYVITAQAYGNGSFIIFPGSSLHHLASTPKYVMYEKTLKTSRQFLTQVMSVKQEWVDEAISMGRLAEDPAVTFADHMFFPFHVVYTGPNILKEIKLKQMELVEMVEVENGLLPFFDFSPEPRDWGVIRAIAQKRCHKSVEHVVKEEVRKLQTKFKKETKEFGVTKEHDWTRVIIGAGGTVQQLIMPYQFCGVIAVCCDENESPGEIKRLLEVYGEVRSAEVLNLHEEVRLLVTYSTVDQAKRAVREFTSKKVFLYPHNCQQFTLLLEWERRKRANRATLLFDSPQHRAHAFSILCSGITFQGSRIKVYNNKFDDKQLFMSGSILCTCEENILKETINQFAVGNFQLKMGYMKCDDKFNSTNKEGDVNRAADGIRDMESNVRDIVGKYARQGSFKVTFITPKPSHISFRAYVTFDDPDEGCRVLNSNLSQECISGRNLHVSPYLKCMIHFRKEIYNIIEDEVKTVRKELDVRYPNLVHIQEKRVKNGTRISLTGYDMKAFTESQNLLRRRAKPHVMQCRSEELKEYIVSPTCNEELETIQKTTSTYIWRQINTMAINIYGAIEKQQTAVTMIEEKARELFSDGARLNELSLRGDGKPAGLMKCLVTKYGYDLNHLLQLEGVRRISLNPRSHLITLLATDEGLHAVRSHVDGLKTVPSTLKQVEAEYDFECSACFTPIDDQKNMLRLECCGHPFHIECIEIQLQPNTLTVPVQCAKEGCSEEFVLRDFENFQKRAQLFRMPNLVSSALQNFLERNTEYKNCPTPDCKMIYIQTDSSKEFFCRSCFESVCSKCHEPYHAGTSCNSSSTSTDHEEKLIQWMTEDPENRRKCPKCHIPIEKNKGCMHVACKCGAHICWGCMDFFETSHECYNHIPLCPAIK